jgi:hypothetical protein
MQYGLFSVPHIILVAVSIVFLVFWWFGEKYGMGKESFPIYLIWALLINSIPFLLAI